LGFILAAANLVGGALEIFQFKHTTFITAPSFWGSAISGILTIGLGCSTVSTILNSWSKVVN
jgi:hypothetical protein